MNHEPCSYEENIFFKQGYSGIYIALYGMPFGVLESRHAKCVRTESTKLLLRPGFGPLHLRAPDSERVPTQLRVTGIGAERPPRESRQGWQPYRHEYEKEKFSA